MPFDSMVMYMQVDNEKCFQILASVCNPIASRLENREVRTKHLLLKEVFLFSFAISFEIFVQIHIRIDVRWT